MNYKSKSLQISCDGGAATGKSTAAKMTSMKYKLKFLSSGLLYRYASFLILKYKPSNKIRFLKLKFKNLDYKKLDKINLQSLKISEHSAVIAKISSIRNILKKFQTTFAKSSSFHPTLPTHSLIHLPQKVGAPRTFTSAEVDVSPHRP